MKTTPDTCSPAFGALLKRWRAHRRVSQLGLSVQTGISARHLSFVETGRSQPSRELVIRLAEHLELPLRERNGMLLAAGYAPIHSEHDLDAAEMAPARAAVREVLRAHQPNPALAVDRVWNIVDANAAAGVFTQLVAPGLLAAQPLNALRLTLHPDGMAPHVDNLAQWRAFVLGGLHRSALARNDAEALALHAELAAYPYGHCSDAPRPDESAAVCVPLTLRIGGERLSFLAMIATFGTALDITLSELAIESFFPADAATAAYLRAWESAPA